MPKTRAPAAPAADESLMLPVETREALVRAESVDDEARTVDIVWTTGAAVRRMDWWSGKRYDEELVVDAKAIRLGRLNAGAPFLNSHNGYSLDAILGVVVDGSARIEKGEGVATIRFSAREDVEPIWRDIKDGVIRNVSVGYVRHRVTKIEREGDVDLWRVEDWEPLEVSAVAIGADPGAGVRAEPSRDLFARTFPCTVVRASPDTQPAATPAASPKERSMPKKTDAGAPGEGDDAPAVEAVDTAAVRAEAERSERTRITTIQGLCRQFGVDDATRAELVGEGDKPGVSVEEARKRILDKLAAADDQGARRGEPRVEFDRGGRNDDRAYGEAVVAALQHRADPRAELPEAAREFRGLSLIEIARDTLERLGLRTRGMSRLEIATEALAQRASPGYHSTADFPFILANVANKRLRAAYDSTPRTFVRWARPATLVDFKPTTRVQLGGAPDLLKVPENGEFTYGTMGEGKEVYALATYGRIIPISRQAIINDDLSAFTRIPAAFGAAAADLESDLVYALLRDAYLMFDGDEVFNEDAGNLLTGAVIDEASLTLAYEAFGDMVGIEGRPIAVMPRHLLVPHGDRYVEARKAVTQTTPSSTEDVNVYAGALEITQEVRLKGQGDDEDPWFLLADYNRIDTVEYATLEGQSGVFTETRLGFEVDGIEIKARHDFAAAPIDRKGMVKNPGAAAGG
jgi:hypothetical protein